MTYSRLSLASVVLLALASTHARAQESQDASAEQPSSALDAWRLVDFLQDPTERDRAACRLLELGLYHEPARYRDKPCERVPGAVNHVIIARQEPDPPVYAVFWRANYEIEGAVPGLPKGPFTLFDSEGFVVLVFINANFLGERDAVFTYEPNGRLAIAHWIPHGAGDDAPVDWTVRVLHVVPISTRQQPVLSVIVGPPTYGFDDECEGIYCGWQQADRDDDGTPEIEIGPFVNAEGAILPRAVYRWSVESERYEGPAGSVAEGFLRIDSNLPRDRDPCCYGRKAMREFALARYQLPTPGDPSAVRISQCESFSLSSDPMN